jgi:hypothetical protein
MVKFEEEPWLKRTNTSQTPRMPPPSLPLFSGIKVIRNEGIPT